MPQPIGGLVIELRSDMATFSSSLAKASRDINTFSTNAERRLNTMTKSIDAGFGKLNKALGVFGLALSAKAVVDFGLNMLRAGGGLKELAEQLGVSTGLLQSLQYGATQAGVSTEELEGGLRKLTQSIGDAASGSKTAIEAFDKIGVKLLDANGALRPTDDIMRDVADAISKIEDPAKRASAIIDIMGRGGQKLLPLMSQGASGIDKIREAAERAGIVLSDDMINRMDDASDSLDAQIFIIQKWAQVWLADSLPKIITEIQNTVVEIQAMYDWIVKVYNLVASGPRGTSGKHIAEERVDELTGHPEAASIDISILMGQVDQVTTALAAANEQLDIAKEMNVGDFGINMAKAQVDALNGKLNELQAKMAELAAAGPLTITLGAPAIDPFIVKEMAPSASQIVRESTTGTRQPGATDTGAASRIKGVIDALNLKTANLTRTNKLQEIYNNLAQAQVTIDSAAGKAIAEKAGHLYDLTFALQAAKAMSAIHGDQAAQEDQDRIAAIGRGRELNDQRIVAIANIEREMQMRERLINAIGDGNRAYEVEQKFQEIINSNRLISVDTAMRLAEAYVTQGEKLDQVRASTQYLADFGDQAFDRIGSAITQAFADGSLAAVDFGGIVKGVISEIIQMLLELSVINPLKNAIFGSALPDLGSVFGGLFGGGSDPLPGGLKFHFAKGGYLPPGQWGMAGEEGAEPIYGGRTGMTVIPHGEGGGNKGTTIYADLRGASVEAVARLERYVAHLDATLDRRAVGAVVSDRLSGRSTRRAFGR